VRHPRTPPKSATERRVHYVQYQYFLFYILLVWGGGAYGPDIAGSAWMWPVAADDSVLICMFNTVTEAHVVNLLSQQCSYIFLVTFCNLILIISF